MALPIRGVRLPENMDSVENSTPDTAPKMLKKRIALLIAAALLVAMGAFFGTRLLLGGPQEQSLSYTDVVARTAAGQVTLAEIEGERVLLHFGEKETGLAVVPAGEAQTALATLLAEKGVQVRFSPKGQDAGRLASALAPLVILLGLGGFGYATWRKKRTSHISHFTSGASKTSFDDVAGVDEAKRGLTETIEFLRDPRKFGKLGGRAPRGLLLTGPPGTGKTLLARAAANEAGVPFLSTSGSSFQELFVGVGASRVRSLFTEARRVAPCVVFVDEIDALGKKRGRGDDSASADADQMLNALLVEMDGFDPTSGIVVLASTNRPDVLDPALLRPGRFDRQITVGLPDVKGRHAILKVHAKNIVLSPSLDLQKVAQATPGLTGADLARLLNEAAILGAREGADSVTWDHVERARDRILMGDERHGMVMSEEERHATAVHEAGHVVVGIDCPNHDPIHKVSILPRGRALGVTQAVPERDRLMYSREYLEDRIAMLLGGRAAEQVILGTMTAGASDDIERAFELARRMVGEMGMSPLGPVHPGSDLSRRSQALLDRIEQGASELIGEQLERAVAIVSARRKEIELLVEGLLERDTLDADEIRACFRDLAKAKAS